MATGAIRYTWVIALLPFISAFFILLFGKRTPGKGAIYGIATVGAGFVMSVMVLWHFVQGGGPYQSSVSWVTIGPLHLEVGQYVDGLTAVMLILVTAVSLCVHVYSVGYMHDDSRYTWFFVVLSIFTCAMLDVVIANNLFQLLIGWEVMGVCSYLLIGHWWEEKENSNAAIKAFLTTKTGDIPFMFGIFALVFATGFATANIQTIGQMAAHHQISDLLLTAAALLLFGGTIGKSAQFPLYVWLPDAMAGPTPVSALIHAATMVAAGVYMVARLFDVFVHADPFVLTVVSAVGALTLLMAAFLALIQDDIKKVLAYSTISQLAYMVAALGMGEQGYPAAMFHLFTHAFFKALLFLGAGSVIHAVHSNNMSDMGGLRRRMPVTFWTYLIGGLALAGVPPLSGFFSKDEIILVAYKSHTWWLAIALLVGAVVTAFYTMRMLRLTFYGEYRGEAHPHESPVSMTGPLVVLAGATIFTGLLGFSGAGAPFMDWVYFGVPEPAEFSPVVAGLSVLVVIIGLTAAYRLYRTYQERDPLRSLGSVYTVLEHKYYLDDLYLNGIVYPIRDRVSSAVYWFNQSVLDRIVNGAGLLTRGLSQLVNLFDHDVIDGAVNGAAHTAGFTGGILKYVQSGNVQRYAAFLFVGVLVLAIVFTRVV